MVSASLELTRQLMGDSSRELTCEPLERLALVSRYESGQWVYRPNDMADSWFRLVSGAARKTASSGDGHRHIVDFLLPGDFFGFCVSSGYPFCVEVIVSGTRIARYARGSAEKLADSNPQVARLLRRSAFASISRLQRRTLILGRRSALEKVSAFLLEMADRSRVAEADQCLYLPMSRYDIADYLAMAVETLCRTLGALRVRGVIAFPDARRVRICNRAVLEHVATQSASARCPVTSPSADGTTC